MATRPKQQQLATTRAPVTYAQPGPGTVHIVREVARRVIRSKPVATVAAVAGPVLTPALGATLGSVGSFAAVQVGANPLWTTIAVAGLGALGQILTTHPEDAKRHHEDESLRNLASGLTSAGVTLGVTGLLNAIVPPRGARPTTTAASAAAPKRNDEGTITHEQAQKMLNEARAAILEQQSATLTETRNALTETRNALEAMRAAPATQLGPTTAHQFGPTPTTVSEFPRRLK